MKKNFIVFGTLLLFAMTIRGAAQDEAEKCRTLSCFVQSAKIHYQHVYKRTKLREDLYHCIDLLKEAAEKFAHKPELYYYLGTFYAEINAVDTVVAYFDSVETFCNDETIPEDDRKHCFKKDKFIEKMSRLKQDFWERFYNDGVTYLSQYDTVKSWMNPSLPDDSIKVLDSLRSLAYTLSKESFELALLAKSNDPRTYDGLAVLLERENNHEEAVKLFKKAMEMIGEDASLVSKIAYGYIYIPMWDSAIVWFKRFLTYEPDDVNSLINLSVAYNSLGEYDKWYEYTTEVLKRQPENTQFLFNGGQYWFMKMQDAAAEMAEITDSTPDAAGKRKNLEQTVSNYHDSAAAYFEKNIAINSEDTDALKRLGILYLLSQQEADKQNAIDVFERYVAIDPDDIDCLDYLGRAYIKLGDTKKAIQPYEMLVENDPCNVNALERLADLYDYNNMAEQAADARARAEECKKL